MCKNLVEKGGLQSPLLIYNRSTKRATDLCSTLPAGKSEVVESIAAGVSKADIIFTCISEDPAVRETIATALEGDVSGKLFVECSTIHPDTTEEIATAVLAKEAEFVAGPVFGAPAAAQAGMLIGVLAGPAASVNKVRPYFKDVMARAEINLSDEPYRKASQLKVIGNTFLMNMAEHTAQGLVVAEKSGLGPAPLQQLIELLFGGAYAAICSRMTSGDYYTREEPLFGVDLARKDIRHAESVASAAGARITVLPVAEGHLQQVKERFGSKGDVTALYGAVRTEAGLKFKNN